MIKKLILFFKYMSDRDTSILKKALIIIGFLYLILPFDLVPDFIIGIGWLDDILAVIFLYIALKAELSNYEALKSAKNMKRAKVIDIRTIEADREDKD